MKHSRQNKILELIANYNIETQEELCFRLLESGFNVTQATVSRDIRELKITKVVGPDGRQVYASYNKKASNEGDNLRHRRVFKDAVMSIDVAMNLLVIKANVGMAPAVGAAIDSMDIPGMVGSIAGDDTLMCAMRSVEEATTAMELLKRML